MQINTAFPVSGVASAQGIDVSNFQGVFDWATAKKQVPNLAFGMFRLTEGLPASHDRSPDPFAPHNRSALNAAGLVQGAYHFLHPSLSGMAQAQYFVEEYGKLGLFDVDMLWLDNEATDGLGPLAIAACAHDFMTELKALRPDNPMGVYTNLDFASNGSAAGLGKYPWWAAHPGGAPGATGPFSKWTFWQWGTRHTSGDTVDADAFNGTVSDFHNWVASFQPQPPKPTGPFRHLTPVSGSTVASIAASRQETHAGFLSRQAKYVKDADAGEITWIGPWYSDNP